MLRVMAEPCITCWGEVMLRMNDGPNPRHLTSRVRTAAPGARFQWLNSQLSSSCRRDAMRAKGHQKRQSPRTAAAKPASA